MSSGGEQVNVFGKKRSDRSNIVKVRLGWSNLSSDDIWQTAFMETTGSKTINIISTRVAREPMLAAELLWKKLALTLRTASALAMGETVLLAGVQCRPLSVVQNVLSQRANIAC